MLYVFHLVILNPKVVNFQSEFHISGFMGPYIWGVLDRETATCFKVSDKALECNYANFFQTIHPFLYFNIRKKRFLKCVDVIFLFNFLSEKSDWYSHVLVSLYWVVKSKVFIPTVLYLTPLWVSYITLLMNILEPS